MGEAHIIKTDDYDYDKDGNKTWNWDKANQNFKTEHGRDREGWDVGKIASKVGSMIK